MIEALLLSVLLLLSYKMLVDNARKSNYMIVSIIVSFALQYIIPVLYLVINGTYVSRFYNNSELDFICMQLCCLIFLFSLQLGQKIFKYTERFDFNSMIWASEIDFKKIKMFLLVCSLLAIILQYQSFNLLTTSGLLANRLIENRGKGYLQILNVTSYFLVFYGIKQYLSGQIGLRYLILHAIPSFVIFSLKLQRGHAVYPLFFVFIAFVYKKYSKKTANILTLCAIISVFYIGGVTSAIRTAIVTGETSIEYKRSDAIPMSFSHAELLTAVISDPRIDKLPNTLVGSFVNWIPLALVKNKPLTLGPVLNWNFEPDSGDFDLKNHRSSYTTDILIEGYYNIGYLGVFLFGFFYSIICHWVWNKACRNKIYSFITFPLALFIYGFTAFYSDLGNWIGYIVIYYGIFLLIYKYGNTFCQRR